jgi:hypothetical protein
MGAAIIRKPTPEATCGQSPAGQVREALEILVGGPGLVFLIQIPSDGSELVAFEFGHLDGSPAVSGADHAAEHQLEHRLLAEGIGDDLQAPTLLDEQTLEEVRRSDRPAVGDRIRKCAMQASKSSAKQRTAVASSVAKSATTPAARSRAIARDGAW